MNYYFTRLWMLSDALFVSGLGIAMLLGGKIIPLLVIAGVLPIPFLLNNLRDNRRIVSLWRLTLPFSFYLIYSIITYFLFTGLEPTEARPINPSLEFYSVAVAMLTVGTIRGLQVRHLDKLFRYLLPWVLIGCFLVMSLLMFAGIREACRVRAAAPWPFIPALLFSTLAFLLLVGWRSQSRREHWIRLLLLGLSIVVATTYTGSRGIAIAQFCVMCLLFLISFLSRFEMRLPNWRQILGVLIGGMALSFIIGFATNCGPAARFATTFDTARVILERSLESEAISQPTISILAPGPTQTTETSSLTRIKEKDSSIGLRLAMWKTSIEAIAERPFLGHGSLYLQRLITHVYGFEHEHNQYLSWSVTGGLIVLFLGLGLLTVPWLVSYGLDLPSRLIITLSVSVLWAISMIFDSFFNLKFYFHYYCLLCGVLYAWTNDILVIRSMAESIE